jgi:hypothetical protein
MHFFTLFRFREREKLHVRNSWGMTTETLENISVSITGAKLWILYTSLAMDTSLPFVQCSPTELSQCSFWLTVLVWITQKYSCCSLVVKNLRQNTISVVIPQTVLCHHDCQRENSFEPECLLFCNFVPVNQVG